MAWYVLGQRRGCGEDLYDLRVELYDLRMLFQKKAVILCVHLISNTQIIAL